MFTEIIKIIEGGLQGDKEKVLNYAEVLADNFNKNGDSQFSKKIKNVLAGKRGKLALLDSFAAKPVDTESRMDIVEISNPKFQPEEIVLRKYLEEEINSFVEGYKRRDELMKFGIDTSSTLLLYGPPGCGKTTLARYIAFLLELPLVTARLDGMISSLLGSTAKNIRKIFDFASKRDCVLFLDEFDVVAKLRDDKNEMGELKRVVNSLLQNIDGLGSNTLLIAATNHHQLLDSAVWRRFSSVIALNNPDGSERSKLITLLLKDISNDVIKNGRRMEQLEFAFASYSHSAIKTVIQNTARNVVIMGKKTVTFYDILREIYLYKNHNIDNEDLFIQYLMHHNVTQKEIHDLCGIPLRKIRDVAQITSKEGGSS